MSVGDFLITLTDADRHISYRWNQFWARNPGLYEVEETGAGEWDAAADKNSSWHRG